MCSLNFHPFGDPFSPNCGRLWTHIVPSSKFARYPLICQPRNKWVPKLHCSMVMCKIPLYCDLDFGHLFGFSWSFGATQSFIGWLHYIKTSAQKLSVCGCTLIQHYTVSITHKHFKKQNALRGGCFGFWNAHVTFFWKLFWQLSRGGFSHTWLQDYFILFLGQSCCCLVTCMSKLSNYDKPRPKTVLFDPKKSIKKAFVRVVAPKLFFNWANILTSFLTDHHKSI